MLRENRAVSLPEYVSRLKPGLWRLRVRVQPKARKSGLAEAIEGRLKVRLTAPPVDNKANQELVAFLARELGIRPRQVSIESGHTGRNKNLLIESDEPPSWDRLRLVR